MRRTRLLLCALLCAVTGPREGPAMPAEPPPLLGPVEQASLDLALRCLKMTRADLAFKKDHAPAPFRLRNVQRSLEQPPALAGHADEAFRRLRQVRSLTTLWQSARAESEWPALPSNTRPTTSHQTLWPPTNTQLVPTELLPILEPLLDSIFLAASQVEQAFRHVAGREALAAAAFAVVHFRLGNDPAETEELERLGWRADILRDWLARQEALLLDDDEYARAMLPAWQQVDLPPLQAAADILLEAVDRAVASLQAPAVRQALPADAQVRIESPLGPMFLGGSGPSHYTEDALLILDLGGDDLYECRAGAANGLQRRPVSVLLDLGGNDTYRSGTLSQGAGLFGVGILVDRAGDDRYEGKHLCQGAGLFGVGVLADHSGADTYGGDIHCQGAGLFGSGILWDREGDDRFRAHLSSQGFGYTGGLGLLLDSAGNDQYTAGGRYPDHERLEQHFLSASQGFGLGMRPDASGGVGILCEVAGNDQYAADVYGQGAGYFYGLGLLLDGEGDDLYRCHQYGQGAGIHLSAGILADWAGHDQYYGGHIVQGAAHDWSVGMLLDKDGDDRFEASSTAHGSALYNSVALLLDAAGDDWYQSPPGANTEAAGHHGDKREYGSIALLLDLGGRDIYSNGGRDDSIAVKPFHGCVLDQDFAGSGCEGLSPVQPVPTEAPSGSVVLPPATNLTRFASSPTDWSLPRDARERRWLGLIRQATQYADSERAARAKALAYQVLKRERDEALPFWLRQLDHENVMIRVRLEELLDSMEPSAAAPALAGALRSPNALVRRHACYFVGKLQLHECAPLVAEQLADETIRTTALWALGELRQPVAFEPAVEFLRHPQEMVRLRAAGLLGKLGDGRATRPLIAALQDDLWHVRYAAQTALLRLGPGVVQALRAALPRAGDRARPYLIEALGQAGDERAAAVLRPYLRSENWLDRGTAVTALAALAPSWLPSELRRLEAGETHPFVRSRLREIRQPTRQQP